MANKPAPAHGIAIAAPVTTNTLGSIIKTASGLIDTFETETQLFGFTPVSFVDGIINAVNDYLFDAVDGLQNFLLEEKLFEDASVTREGMNKVLALLQAEVDKNFDKFELYVFRNILKVPTGAKLPGDYRHAPEQFTAADEEAVDQELLELRTKLRAARLVNKELRSEADSIKALSAQTSSMLSSVDEVVQSCKRNNVPFIAENASFACDQARELSGAVAKLSTKRSHKEAELCDDESTSSRKMPAASAGSHSNIFGSGKSFKEEFEEKRRETKMHLSLKDMKKFIEII